MGSVRRVCRTKGGVCRVRQLCSLYNNNNNTNNNNNSNNNGQNVSFFNVAGYLIEERRRWPIINASPRGQCSK